MGGMLSAKEFESLENCMKGVDLVFTWFSVYRTVVRSDSSVIAMADRGCTALW